MSEDFIKKYLHNWRNEMVLSQVKGKLLDIACGENTLVGRYEGEGVGLDVKQWGNVDVVVDDSSDLPFPDASFDTISIVASLHYLPNLKGTIQECYRILRPKGRLVVTTISERVGDTWAKVRGLNNDWDHPLTLEGVKPGVSASDAKALFRECQLTPVLHKRFMLGFNNLIVAEK